MSTKSQKEKFEEDVWGLMISPELFKMESDNDLRQILERVLTVRKIVVEFEPTKKEKSS
jgi:hypothetical protein